MKRKGNREGNLRQLSDGTWECVIQSKYLNPMPKGQFVVMNTGFYPMKVKLKLFFKWGIEFEDEYEVHEHGNRKVYYAEKREILEGIRNKYQMNFIEEYELPPSALPMGGQQQTRTQLRTTPKSYREVNRSE